MPATESADPKLRALAHSEAFVLGSAIQNPTWVPRLREMAADDFYEEPNRKLLQAILRLSEKGTPIDLVTVGAEASRASGRDLALCANDCVEAVTDSGLFPYHQPIVLAAARRRKIIVRMQQGLAQLKAAWIDEADNVAHTIQDDLRALRRRSIEIPLTNPSDHVERLIAMAQHGPDQSRHLQTGIWSLDETLSGLGPGDLVIVAGLANMGKSSFADQIVSNVLNQERSVFYISLEVNPEQVSARIVCQRQEMSFWAMRRGRLSKGAQERFRIGLQDLVEQRLTYTDRAAVTVDQVTAAATAFHERSPIDLVVLDHIQIMAEGGKDNRNLEVAKISRGLKMLARDLDIPVLALSQLNRQVANRQSTKDQREPRLADLRDSGAIEQDADVVIFIHRPALLKDSALEEDKRVARIIVGKHRNGPTGAFAMDFDTSCLRFRDSKEPRR